LANNGTTGAVSGTAAERARPGLLSRSLSAKFIATLTPIFVAVFLTCVVVETLHSYEKARQGLTRKLDTLAASQSIILAESIASNDANQLSLMLASIISEPDLIGIAVYGAEGEVMDSFGVLDTPDTALVKSISVNFTEGDEVRRVGTLKLVMTERNVIQAIHTQLLNHLLLGLALLAAALFASIFAHRRTVVKPLGKLLSAIQESHGGSHGRVAWESEDEIGRLIGSYNDMQNRLDSYERELKDIQGQLEQRVVERTRDLITAREAAEQASRVKSKFLSSMSHEFRTPMNAILGFTQILKMAPQLRADERLFDRLEKIEESSLSLMALLDDIMTFSQLESGGDELIIEDICPLAAALDAVTLVAPLAESRRVSINVEDIDVGAVRADAQMLRKALFNLLSNAVKYNHSGGSVRVSIEQDSGGTEIAIADTGQGIPASQFENVFEPFNRIGREAGAIGGGGIGLTITQQIIESMGGKIDFESIEGQGSTFRVIFATPA